MTTKYDIQITCDVKAHSKNNVLNNMLNTKIEDSLISSNIILYSDNIGRLITQQIKHKEDSLNMDTYKVTIKLKVTAESEKEALNYALNDAVELYHNKSLDAHIVKKD